MRQSWHAFAHRTEPWNRTRATNSKTTSCRLRTLWQHRNEADRDDVTTTETKLADSAILVAKALLVGNNLSTIRSIGIRWGETYLPLQTHVSILIAIKKRIKCDYFKTKTQFLKFNLTRNRDDRSTRKTRVFLKAKCNTMPRKRT